MFFPTWIECFYVWKRRQITVLMIQKKNNGSTWLALFPFLPAMISNKWDIEISAGSLASPESDITKSH